MTTVLFSGLAEVFPNVDRFQITLTPLQAYIAAGNLLDEEFDSFALSRGQLLRFFDQTNTELIMKIADVKFTPVSSTLPYKTQRGSGFDAAISQGVQLALGARQLVQGAFAMASRVAPSDFKKLLPAKRHSHTLSRDFIANKGSDNGNVMAAILGRFIGGDELIKSINVLGQIHPEGGRQTALFQAMQMDNQTPGQNLAAEAEMATNVSEARKKGFKDADNRLKFQAIKTPLHIKGGPTALQSINEQFKMSKAFETKWMSGELA